MIEAVMYGMIPSANRAMRESPPPENVLSSPRIESPSNWFDAGTEVTLEALQAHGLAKRKGVPVKVLGGGELTKKLTVHAHGFSAAARERIEAAGGTCQIIE